MRKKKNMGTSSEHGHGQGAIDHPLGHRIEEHEFVRIGQHFVTPERTLKAEMLHQLGEASTAAASARRRLQQQEKEWTAEERDGRKLMSSAEVQQNDCLLDEEARDAGDEILKDELLLEAAIVDQDDGDEENRAVEASDDHKCNCPRCHHSETEMIITNEQVLEAIKEVVTEAIRSANGDKKVRNDKTQVKVEEEEKHEGEMKMEVLPQMEDPEFSDETQTNHLLETQDQVGEEKVIHSSESCIGCARRAAQKLQCSMTQDPTVSLRGAELLFSSYIEEKETIMSDFDRALETIDSELDFFFGQLADDYESAAGPETRLALGELDEVAGVIFDALEVDVPILTGVINDAVEVAIDKAADCVVEVVDFTVGFTKWLVEGVRKTADGMVFVVDTLSESASAMIEEGKGISTDLFGIQWPAPPPSPSFPEKKDKTAIDCFKASTEEEVELEAEPDAHLEATVPYLTPVDVFALVVKGLLGRSNQSADVALSQWPAKTGLTEWPLSGAPRSNLKQQSAE